MAPAAALLRPRSVLINSSDGGTAVIGARSIDAAAMTPPASNVVPATRRADIRLPSSYSLVAFPSSSVTVWVTGWRRRPRSAHDGVVRYESWVERQIREATERGEFSGLTGSGKPLDLGNPDDPDWWVKRYLEREGLDASATMPPVMQLRREAAGYPESLLDVPDEGSVREILRDYNLRVVADRRRPVVGRAMPVTAPRIDIDAMVVRWRALRAEAAARAVQADERVTSAPAVDPAAPVARRRWWPWPRPRRRNFRP